MSQDEPAVGSPRSESEFVIVVNNSGWLPLRQLAEKNLAHRFDVIGRVAAIPIPQQPPKRSLTPPDRAPFRLPAKPSPAGPEAPSAAVFEDPYTPPQSCLSPPPGHWL
jgi:hypothetical protein